MKEDRNAAEAGQGLIVDTAEGLREHLRGCVRRALKEIFEEKIGHRAGYRPSQK